MAYACDLRGPDADGCAEIIYKTAGLIARDDEEIRAALRALTLRAAVTKDEIQLAYRLLRKGVPGSQLATAVRRAKLGLGEPPRFCERLTLCDRGVVLGCETVIAPLNELPGERLGLKVDGRAEEILALLSIARGAPTPTDVLDRLNGESRALQRGNRVLAEMELALVGQPVLAGRAAAEALAKTADALEAGVDARILVEALGISPPAEKASPDDPIRPGWPKGAPNSQGGRFRPKTPEERAATRRSESPPSKGPAPDRRMTEALAAAVKLAIRGLLKEAESAPNPYLRIAALLAEVGLEAYPYVKAYFDPPKTLEELQAATQLPSEVGYEDHHIVEQNTKNPDGSEDQKMDAPDNLARIPTAKHWRLNSWYETRNFECDGMTPRQYLPGKSWDERRRVGLIGLRYIGVLK